MAGLLCRICLTRGTRMCTTYNTPLEVLYQKITNIPLKTQDGRPHVVCYICYHLLNKCHKFIESAVKTDKVLQQLCSNGIQLTEQHVAHRRAFLCTPLTKSRVININAISDSDGVTMEVPEIKREIEESSLYYEVEVFKEKAESLEGFDDLNKAEPHSRQYACSKCGHCSVTQAEARKHYKWHGASEEPYLDCLNYLFGAPPSVEVTLQPITAPTDSKEVIKAQIDSKEAINAPTDHKEALTAPTESKEALLAPTESKEALTAPTESKEALTAPNESKEALTTPTVSIQAVTALTGSIQPVMAPTDSEDMIKAATDSKETVMAPSHNKGDQIKKALNSPQTIIASDTNENEELPEREELERKTKLPKELKEDSPKNCENKKDFKIDLSNKIGKPKNIIKKKLEKATNSEGTVKKKKITRNIKPKMKQSGNKFSGINLIENEVYYEVPLVKSEDPLDTNFKNNIENLNSSEEIMDIENIEQIDENPDESETKKIAGTGKSYPCDSCEKVFPSNARLKRHKRVHTGEKPFSCEHCSKTFADKCNLSRHARIHSGEKPFACELCEKRFSIKTNLSVHLLTHNNSSEIRTKNTLSCDTCGKLYTHKMNLARHISIKHSDVKQENTDSQSFVCDFCQFTCNSKHYLVKHMKMHIDKKPFACSYCGKGFTKNQLLIDHVRTHTGEKPYLCNKCGKKFIQKSNLKRHLKCCSKKNVTVKPFPCNCCGRLFGHRSNLKRHLRSCKMNIAKDCTLARLGRKVK